ncbi:MAG: site-specific DNA-methyltransferase [Thaumarchaeota archaeon]|nr:site-specific DNA-methyltransferase [Nitrososphaerota archaeon]
MKRYDGYRHESSGRVKIPTESDDRYMLEYERQPIPFCPEARSEDGNPRLSWRRHTKPEDITLMAHPLFGQIKVDPSWFINHLVDSSQHGGQTQLFPFNGFPEGSKYSWYKYSGNWSNRLIHGNSSMVMASLLGKEHMRSKVQMIYFDPPFGIKYDSMHQISTDRRDGATHADSTSRRAFRDDYKDGIHSYLDGVYRVVTYSRDLLADSGSLFLQIGNENVHRVALVLDEAFGAENRMATITFLPTNGSSTTLLPEAASYILWYAKDKEQVKYNRLYEKLSSRKDVHKHMSSYAMVELADGSSRSLSKQEEEDPDKHLPNGAKLFKRVELSSQGESKTGRSEPFVWNGTEYACPRGRHWSVSHEDLQRLADIGRLVAVKEGSLGWKWYEGEIPGRKIHNVWCSTMPPPTGARRHFIVETAESVIERCMFMTTDPGDLVLDPTCGRGTTAYVAEKWGRRWITIDVNPVQIALCRQGMITAIHDWYLTLDSHEGRCAEAELAGTEPPTTGRDPRDKRYDPSSGFVYKRKPTVSAKTLASGPEKPDTTLLVDQPVKKHGTKRISSPFTVESHARHKYVGTRELDLDRDDISSEVLEAANVAGVIIPGSEERWHLDNAESWPNGTILTHTARVRETGERVAVVLLADDEIAAINLINKAAEDAADNSFNRLLILSFEFEPSAYDSKSETRGRLVIHKVKINNDLTIKELKHTEGDATLVMVGEPDIDVRRHGETEWVVEINGYVTFNPRAPDVKQGNADDVDCWMLDTNYDGQSFFARRIHLPGKGKDSHVVGLKKDLSTSVNPEYWDSMLSLKSAPFESPSNGRIAVCIVTKKGETMTTIHDMPLER